MQKGNNYSDLEQDVFKAQNQVRQNPTSAIPKLEERLKYFKGSTLYLPGKIGLITNEGPAAVNECISYLKKQKPLPPLQWSNGLSNAARDHAYDIGPKGICGHTGSDGSSMQARIERYGKWMGQIGENIDFGNKESGLDVIIALIIDDGVSSRGHRANVFNEKFKITGIACGPHKVYESCCVFDYAGELTENGKPPQKQGAQPTQIAQQKPAQKMDDQFEKKFQQMKLDMDNQNQKAQQIKMKQAQQDFSSGGNANEPAGYISKHTSKSSKTVNGKTTTVETITYKMKDGSTQTVTKTTTTG